MQVFSFLVSGLKMIKLKGLQKSQFLDMLSESSEIFGLEFFVNSCIQISLKIDNFFEEYSSEFMVLLEFLIGR